MGKREKLRQVVAQLAGLKPEVIGPDFSLRSRGLQSSVRRAALAAAIRRQLGSDCPQAYTAATFAELEAAVRGEDARPIPAAAKPVESPSLSLPSRFDGPDGLACGMDIEMVAALPVTDNYWEHEFYKEAFSKDEIAYCLLQENPRMHFAARWCAKEALVKCDPAFKGQPFSAMEVVHNDSGEVSLAHDANGTRQRLSVAISISHTDAMAAAIVVRRPSA